MKNFAWKHAGDEPLIKFATDEGRSSILKQTESHFELRSATNLIITDLYRGRKSSTITYRG